MDDGQRDDPPRRAGATRKIPTRFPVYPTAQRPQIWRVPRSAAIAAILLAAAAPLRSADDIPPRFNQVEIRPTTSSIFIGTVTMTMPPFVRRDTVFSSTYMAQVFPYFFWNESGRIWIVVPADKIRRVVQGEAVDFTGRGISESGDERKIDGRATPTGPSGGRIRVRVFVSRRIFLAFDTTYVLEGAAPAPVTPTRSR